jgi:uncharacterized membrane protein
MTIKFNRNLFLIVIIGWEYSFLLLSALQGNSFQVLNIFGTITLAVLPGLLTLTLLKLERMPFWVCAGLTIGLSLFELSFMALIGNAVLPHFGITRPLDRPALLAEFAVLVPTLFIFNWGFDREPAFNIRPFALLFTSARDAFVALTPVLFVVMSIIGAIRLNNGADGSLTLLMLIGIAMYSVFIIWKSEKLGPNVLPTAIFFISLSLLLMTSLRGWLITGHDIQREFGVFQLTKANGLWNIALYRDAYNACMSITILPTIFSNVLKIADPYIYKLLFQIFFATVPAILFLIIRRYASSAIAFLSVLYFISFPTFFGDMPFLNRQEMAFLFFALMLYVVGDEAITPRKRQVLFLIFGIGMVLSHYTTTYIVVALLAFLVIARPLVRVIGRRLSQVKIFRNSAYELLHPVSLPKSLVSVWVVVALAGASFLWSSVLTNTASESLSRVITQTIAVMRNAVHQDAQSNDVSYSLFSRHKIDLPALYANYQKDIVAGAHAKYPDAYYASSTYARYSAPLAQENRMPLTLTGKILQSHGINVPVFNDNFRQKSATFLQLLVLIGLIVGLFNRTFVRFLLDTDFVLLSVASVLFVVAQIVLPILSIEYGLLRAFQQSLFFLSLFTIAGSFALLFRASERKKVVFASGLAILFFLSSTGVITQLLGGYGAQLHLNNAGSYYDTYYLHKGETLSVQWLKNKNLDSDRVQTTELLAYQLGLDSVLSNGIYPGLVRKNSYVLLGNENVNEREAGTSYQGSFFSYTYPMQFLDDNKDEIYDSGTARIYR